jgi:CubicO group peptidase (beta-lactamase class C family)
MNKKLFLSFLSFLPFFVKLTFAQSTEYSTEVEGRIKQVENNLMTWVQTQDSVKWSLTDRMAHYHINGISIAVIHNYNIEWAKGYGWADISEKRPATNKTLFQAASLSKSINAVGLMKMVQDKKLELNTDINQYLTSWKFPYDATAKNKKITIGNLLSHTAGLSVNGFGGYAVGDKLPLLTQILDGKKPSNSQAVRSLSEPGIKFQYSGGGVTISQLIVTDVTHQPYDEFMNETVLKPLEMTNSFFTQPPSESKAQLLATGYYGNGKEVKGKYHIYPEQAAAGLWTNPSDLCKFIIEIQSSNSGKSYKVLSPEITKVLLTPYIENSPALGLFIIKLGNTEIFSNSGLNCGFTCMFNGSSDGDGVVIMANSDNSQIFDEILYSIASVYNWKYHSPVHKNVIKMPQTLLESYCGNYKYNGQKVKLKLIDNNLYLLFRGMTCRIYFTSNVDFFVYEAMTDFKILLDTNGNIDKINFAGDQVIYKVK